MTLETVSQAPWFTQLEPEQQNFIRDGLLLLEREKRAESKDRFFDYAFILFPISKAYEGFLKHYLFRFKFISRRTMEGRHFRIGRALNPDVRKHQRDEDWIYDDIAHLCGKDLARQLWDTWLVCRNRVFHYFPPKVKHLTLQQAEESVNLVLDSLQRAYQCRMENE